MSSLLSLSLCPAQSSEPGPKHRGQRQPTPWQCSPILPRDIWNNQRSFANSVSDKDLDHVSREGGYQNLLSFPLMLPPHSNSCHTHSASWGTVPRALTPVPQSKSNCLWMTTTAHVMVSLDSSCRKWQRPSKESRLSNWRDRGTET